MTLDGLMPYLVGIGWDHELIERRPNIADRDLAFDRQSSICTGFLVHQNSATWIVTAGHVITLINESTSPPRRLVAARIYDRGGHLGMGVIPYPLELAPRYHIDREDEGLDLGAILVHGHYARLIFNGGAQAFTPDQFAKDGDDFDTFAVMGFPFEHTQIKSSRKGRTRYLGVRMGTPLMPLRMIKSPPAMMVKKYNRFYAKIRRTTFKYNNQTIKVRDIDGMSGGPVVGLQVRKRDIRFRLVGVQSAWSPKHLTIAACPVADFMAVIDQKLQEAYPKVDEQRKLAQTQS